MKWYKNQKVTVKIIIPVLVGFIVLVGIFRFYILPMVEETFMQEKKEYLKAVVDATYSLVSKYENEYKEGKISKEEALSKIENVIRTVRFEGNNYLFLFNSEIMVFHGVNPKLEGRKIDEFKDVNGKIFLREAADGIKNQSDLFFEYYWNKPNVEGAFPKLSYIRKTPVFNNILGAGIYIDMVQEIISSLENSILLQTVIVILIIFGSLWLIIKLTINKPLNDLISAANDVANGKLDTSLSYVSKDEIGSVFNSVRNMINNLKAVIDETQKLNESASEGNLDTRGDYDKFSGAYADLIKGMNNTLDAIIQPLNIAAEYVDRISKGDIPQKINENFKGDFNEIKNNINQCIDAINAMIADTNNLINSTIEGKLNTRADITRHNGDFRKIVSGINHILDRLVGLIDNMPLPVQIVDKQNKILYANKKAIELI